MGNTLLLTGEPRIGKSTAIKKIMQMIGEANCGGFFTEEVCVNGDRIGFDCVSLEGDRIRIADVSLDSDLRVGRYGIDLDAFEDFVLKKMDNLQTSKKIIIIDEIGPIQILSSKFKQQLRKLLSGNENVIGTIFYKEHTEIDEIKYLPGVKLITLNHENRNSIIDIVMHEVYQYSTIRCEESV